MNAIENLKERTRSQIKAMKDNTSYKAGEVFTQQLFPKEHMLRSDNPDDLPKLLNKVTDKTMKDHHKSFNALLHSKWIVVGDVSSKEVVSVLEKKSDGSGCSLPIKRKHLDALPPKKVVKKVLMNWKKLTVLTRVNLSDFTQNLDVFVSRSKVNLQTYDSRARERRN